MMFAKPPQGKFRARTTAPTSDAAVEPVEQSMQSSRPAYAEPPANANSPVVNPSGTRPAAPGSGFIAPAMQARPLPTPMTPDLSGMRTDVMQQEPLSPANTDATAAQSMTKDHENAQGTDAAQFVNPNLPPESQGMAHPNADETFQGMNLGAVGSMKGSANDLYTNPNKRYNEGPTPPSKGRKILANIAGFGLGALTMNPLVGMGVRSAILNEPTNEATANTELARRNEETNMANQGKVASAASTGAERQAQNVTAGASALSAQNKAEEEKRLSGEVTELPLGTGVEGQTQPSLIKKFGGVDQTPQQKGPVKVSPATKPFEPQTKNVRLSDGTTVAATNDPNKGTWTTLDGRDVTKQIVAVGELGDTNFKEHMDLWSRSFQKDNSRAPTEKERLKEEDRYRTLPGVTINALNNPKGSSDDMSYIADVAEQRGIDAALKLVTGNVQKSQLADELAKRGGNIFKSFADLQKVSGQEATFANFHSNIAEVRKYLPSASLNPTLVSLALADPESTLGKQLQGRLASGNLSKEQINLVQSLRTLREDLFGLRQFFGNSPVRSNAQVQIMMSQLPSEAALASGKIEISEAALKQLERSIAPIEKKFGDLSTLKVTKPAAGGKTPALDFSKHTDADLLKTIAGQ